MCDSDVSAPTYICLSVFLYGIIIDVRAILNSKPHRHAGYEFDVSEFYEGVGMCKSKGLIIYSSPNGEFAANPVSSSSLNATTKL